MVLHKASLTLGGSPYLPVRTTPQSHRLHPGAGKSGQCRERPLTPWAAAGRSRGVSPPSSPAAGRPGTAVPPGSWCGSGAAGPVGSQTAMLAEVVEPRLRLGRGSAFCPAAQPSSVPGLDWRPRVAPALG